jgi:Trypsin-like peptidase domain
LIHNAIIICDENGTERGTGFVIGDKERIRFFLVTNKHVIGGDKFERDKLKEIALLTNIQGKDSSVRREGIKYRFVPGSVREHSDPDVDVMAFDITGLIVRLKQQYNERIPFQPILLNELATPELIQKYDVKIGDEIIVIGFPNLHGLQHPTTSFPIVRQGIIASNIGEPLQDHKNHAGKDRIRLIRGFLIDGAIIPGSSGSPVFLKPSLFRSIKGMETADSFPLLVLGIISEYRKSYTTDLLWPANLGIAIDASAIIETLNAF